MKDKKYYDKVIAGFFLNIKLFLDNELNKTGVDKKKVENNISCLRMFACNPAKFTKEDAIRINRLQITPDGFGNRLFDIVSDMICMAHEYYYGAFAGSDITGKLISELDRKAKMIIIARSPLFALRLKLLKYRCR